MYIMQGIMGLINGDTGGKERFGRGGKKKKKKKKTKGEGRKEGQGQDIFITLQLK
jgi:hypothetical protein